MLIGEISKKTSFSRDTIRYYEKIGLIKAEASNSLFNNYKNYTPEVLQRLFWIKKAKAFGFSLKEIATLLDLMDVQQANCGFVEEKVNAKIQEIDQKIKALTELKQLITERINEAKNWCKALPEGENCQFLTDF